MGDSRVSRTPAPKPDGFGGRQFCATATLAVTSGISQAPDLHHPVLDVLAQHGVWVGLGWAGAELLIYVFDKRSLHLMAKLDKQSAHGGKVGEGGVPQSKSPVESTPGDAEEDDGFVPNWLPRV